MNARKLERLIDAGFVFFLFAFGAFAASGALLFVVETFKAAAP